MLTLLSFLNEIDIFGKKPHLYYKGNRKKSSIIGIILTWIYIIIYIAYFIYRIIRFVSKKDIKFYETDSEPNEVPSIDLSGKNFKFQIMLTDKDDKPTINEEIYNPSGILYHKKTDGQNILINQDKLKFEKNEKNYYSINIVDFTLEGSIGTENYSYIHITLNKCDIAKNPKCQTATLLNDYNVKIIFQDIIFTPKNQSHPAQIFNKYLTIPIYDSMTQKLIINMQLVNIKTSQDKIEKYLQYDNTLFIPSLNHNVNEETFLELTIQLDDKILTKIIEYENVIQVLGGVGGFMFFVNSIFNIISIYIVNILYEKSLVDELFCFNLEQRRVLINKPDNLNGKTIKIFNRNQPYKKNSQEYDSNSNQSGKISLRKMKNQKNTYINMDRNDNKNNSIEENNSGININNSGNNDNKSGENFTNNNVIKNLNYNSFLIYFCCCFLNKNKDIVNLFYFDSIRIISTKFDIIHLFKRLYSKSKSLNYVQ